MVVMIQYLPLLRRYISYKLFKLALTSGLCGIQSGNPLRSICTIETSDESNNIVERGGGVDP